MFSRFKLTLGNDFGSYYDVGLRLYNQTSTMIKQSLETFLIKEDRLDGSRLQQHWFPQVDADIFLSHSHADKDLAISLAGWLKQKFDLNLFVDSCVWGYADDLLKQIDDKYCVIPGSETYCYQKRNGSTSHVHMMLIAALTKLIDQTECVCFLNTPNSISSENAVTKTKSPWLYSEIAISEVIRYKAPIEHRDKSVAKLAKILESEGYRAGLNIEYDVNLQEMKEIGKETLFNWHRRFMTAKKKHPLDCLYEIYKR
ncbi:MAG: hypothetical protein GQF41_3800 [Candidatus Rifleibacterium amylolyticum]|nr:MAG: hypothetical protein GQF41_3800 [Candidatus Rifleibacterium amylolyticum]